MALIKKHKHIFHILHRQRSQAWGNPIDSPITSGGAIHVDSLSNVRIVDSTFEGNTADGSAEEEHGRGGALYCRSQSTVSVLSSHFESNTAEAGGQSQWAAQRP